MRLWFRVAASAIVWFVVALEYYLIAREPDVTLIEAAIRLLADFTILTNILVALAMTLLWLAPDSILGVFFSRPSVRTAIASYIIVSSTVYYLILRGLWEPKRSGLSRRRDRALYRARALSLRLAAVRAEGHAAMQQRIDGIAKRIKQPPRHRLDGEAVTGFYPYHFLEATQLGYDRVLLNMGVLTAAFVGLA